MIPNHRGQHSQSDPTSVLWEENSRVYSHFHIDPLNADLALFFSTGLVEIQTLSSLFILLKTSFGLKILFAIDGERIYLQLTSAWKRRTLGLCGTFNGNIRDDFL